MIYTGSCPLSPPAIDALDAAVRRAERRSAQFADCDDLFVALSEMTHGEAADMFRVLGMPAGVPSAGADRPTIDAPRPEHGAPAANRPLQRAIELAVRNRGITTGHLLVGLARVNRGATAAWMRAEKLSEADLERALASCAPEAMA
jgi:ATP-dependent Clp protease ATP-binding subunit ClpA